MSTFRNKAEDPVHLYPVLIILDFYCEMFILLFAPFYSDMVV